MSDITLKQLFRFIRYTKNIKSLNQKLLNHLLFRAKSDRIDPNITSPKFNEELNNMKLDNYLYEFPKYEEFFYAPINTYGYPKNIYVNIF
jgi:hypothetical protein